MPDPAALQEAAGRSGFRKLHLDAAHRTVTLDIAGMALDVGAIGKGYAASEAIEVLGAARRSQRAGGGERRPRVQRRAPRAARLAHRRPLGRRRRSRASRGVLELTNAAVSTSGSSEQHLDVDGRRYSHIIDPSSGMGLVDDITVTVIARHGLDADGLDTAVSVLGADRGLALIESRPGAAALVIQGHATGRQASERVLRRTTVRPSARFLELAARVAVAG